MTQNTTTIYKVSIVDQDGNITNACMGYYSGIAAIRKRFGRIIDDRGEDIDYISGKMSRVFFRPWESDEDKKRNEELMTMLGQSYSGESWYAIEPVTFYFCVEDKEAE